MAHKDTTHDRKTKYFDYSLLFTVLFLLGFGLIMLYSTTSYAASLKGDGMAEVRRQAISVLVGLGVMIIGALIPYRAYKPFWLLILFVGAASLFLVLTRLGVEANGARRWILIGGRTFQPSEFCKLCVIVSYAVMLSKMSERERVSWKGFIYTFLPVAAIGVILVVVTNNLSSAIIIAGIAFVMAVIASKRYVKAWILFAVVVGASVFAVIAVAKGWGSSFIGFRGERILAWLDLEAYADGKGFQTLQALYGIGSGGVWGKGLGKSIQKLGYLPEAENDMIFSVICEELGLFGGLAIIVMYLLLLWRLRDIVYYSKDLCGSLIVTGIFAHISIQVLLNIAVVTNTLPNTGITLPFISQGGSSIIFLLAEIGIAMNVASNADFSDRSKENDGVKVNEEA